MKQLFNIIGKMSIYMRRKPHVILENYKSVIIIYGKINGKIIYQINLN